VQLLVLLLAAATLTTFLGDRVTAAEEQVLHLRQLASLAFRRLSTRNPPTDD